MGLLAAPHVNRLVEYICVYTSHIDGFQMSIKRPPSGGQTHDKRQLHSGSFNLREATSFIFWHWW